MLIFPTSIAARYTTGLRGVIGPLGLSFRQHLALLGTSTSSPDFSPMAVRASASKAESGLAPLAASARLLGRDISWGRFSGKDLDGMREKVQRLVMRTHGMNVYFALIDTTRERFPVTPVPSHPGSAAAGTPNESRPSSPTRIEESASAPPVVHHSTVASSHAEVEQHRGRQALRRHPHFDVDSTPHSARPYLHRMVFREHVVGVFESQKYLDLESHHFGHPLSVFYTERSNALLRQSCEPLLHACSNGLGELDAWLGTSRPSRFLFWLDICTCEQRERVDALSRTCDELARTLEAFRESMRFVILAQPRSF